MPEKLTLPKNLSVDTVMEAVKEAMSDTSNPGFCLSCGEPADGCEPDARHYNCERCGSNMVFGAEQILIECVL